MPKKHSLAVNCLLGTNRYGRCQALDDYGLFDTRKSGVISLVYLVLQSAVLRQTTINFHWLATMVYQTKLRAMLHFYIIHDVQNLDYNQSIRGSLGSSFATKSLIMMPFCALYSNLRSSGLFRSLAKMRMEFAKS